MSHQLATGANDDRVITYTPFGEEEEIKLTVGMARSFIAVPTRSGKLPSDADLMRFLMLCKAGRLNPWTRDAYLVGYDSQDGPKFSLITAIQALYKRSEANKDFQGLESGVVVLRKGANGEELVERQGDMVLPGEKLVGGWAKCYRANLKTPFYDALNFSTYSTGKSQWAKDGAGMIVKCAEASVLRKAFPTTIGGMYIDQERGAIESGDVVDAQRPPQNQSVASLTQEIVKKLPSPPAETKKAAAPKATAKTGSPPAAKTQPVDDDTGPAGPAPGEQEYARSLYEARKRQEEYEASLPASAEGEYDPANDLLVESNGDGVLHEPVGDEVLEQETSGGGPGIANWEYVEQQFTEAADLAQVAKLQDEFSSGAPAADVEMVAKIAERAKKRIRSARSKAKNP